MKTKYYCDYCKKDFTSKDLCLMHEKKCKDCQLLQCRVEERLLHIFEYYTANGYTLNVHFNSDEYKKGYKQNIFVYIPVKLVDVDKL